MRRIVLRSCLTNAGGLLERGRVLPSSRRGFNRRVVATVPGEQKTRPLICLFMSPIALYAEM
jgi:hypothetical protein